jgi:arylsulfatase A
MSFMDAHSGSAVCTPTRYGLLTGRYSWRSRLKKFIVPKWDGALIEKDRMTIGSMLQKEGYNTACIGKWHLGMDWTFKALEGELPLGNWGALKKLAEQGIDWTQPIKNGPTERGFDYHFGDDTINWPPYTWIENDKVIGTIDPKTFKTDDESWAENKVLPTITNKAVSYITEQAKTEKPFFLYFPMTSPHSPIAPADDFIGKSGISPYVDFCIETDYRIGQIVDAVDKAGIADNTIIILTADNGTSIKFPSKDGSLAKGVNFNNSYRGAKSDIFEGGHNVPFIVRWPKNIKAGSTNKTPICLTDIMATVADVVSIEVPDNAAEDSVSLLPALKGEKLERGAIINHSIQGRFAIRKGKWKLAFCAGSGGWSSPKDNVAKKQGLPELQLYNLDLDPKETKNLINENPELVKELTKQLHEMISKGRTTPGADQHNVGETWLPEL